MAIVNGNVTLYRLNPTLTSVWMEKQLRQHSGFEVLALESVLEEVHDAKSWELLQDSTDYRLLFSLSVRVRKQLDGNWQTFFSLVFFSSFPFFFFLQINRAEAKPLTTGAHLCYSYCHKNEAGIGLWSGVFWSSVRADMAADVFIIVA